MRIGYKTLIADMSSSLSGSQKQRVLLARALYKRPKVLAKPPRARRDAGTSRERGHLRAQHKPRLHRAPAETIDNAQRLVTLHSGQVVHDVVIAKPAREHTAPALAE